MTNALDWLNEQGGNQQIQLGDSVAVVAHVEKFHPITDELNEYLDNNLASESIDLDLVRLFNGDEVIETAEAIDETGFLLSQGFVPIGEYDGGTILFNANDASVHMTDIDGLDLSRVEYDENSEEYFWDGDTLEDSIEDYEMVFENNSTAFNSFNEFDQTLTAVLRGEIEPAELGL